MSFNAQEGKMKSLFVTVALCVVVSTAVPTSNNTISYMDKDGNVVTENLDEPKQVPYGFVSPNKLRLLVNNGTNLNETCTLNLGDKNPGNPCFLSSVKQIKIIVHGWMGNANGQFPVSLGNAFLKAYSGSTIVLRLDWSAFSVGLYSSAALAVGEVGRLLGNYIKYLVEKGYVALQKLFMYGWSLGAHIVGIASKILRQAGLLIPRILGMDPAGPMFKGQGSLQGLMKDQAKTTVTINTSDGLGSGEGRGHINFYPDGGNNQKGCNGIDKAFCNHGRCWQYVIDTLVFLVVYPGQLCANEMIARNIKVAPNECEFNSVLMGDYDYSPNVHGAYYVPILNPPISIN